MTAKAPEYPISKRVHHVWKKLSDWYSAATIAREFGAIPPKEWCEVIDSIKTRKDLEQVLTEVRRRHVTFPPRFPEFEKIVHDVVRAPTLKRRGSTLQEQLIDFIQRTKPLSKKQRVNRELRWQFLYVDGEFSAIQIPADPSEDAPAYRVTVEDMHMQLSQEQVGGRLAYGRSPRP